MYNICNICNECNIPNICYICNISNTYTKYILHSISVLYLLYLYFNLSIFVVKFTFNLQLTIFKINVNPLTWLSISRFLQLAKLFRHLQGHPIVVLILLASYYTLLLYLSGAAGQHLY